MANRIILLLFFLSVIKCLMSQEQSYLKASLFLYYSVFAVVGGKVPV